MTPKIGLVLSGGGARGAYQAGVIKALGEIAFQAGITRPFPIITGISAGALNAGYLAAHADDIRAACRDLSTLWSTIHTGMVFRSNISSLMRIGLRLMGQLIAGGMYRSAAPQALLDTRPLGYFLNRVVPPGKIAENLRRNFLDAISITATDYGAARTVSFVQSAADFDLWTRARRTSVREDIRTEHLMASSALPVIFPPIRIGDRYYGDGSLRNTAPLSPAVHLGADRLIVISVRKETSIVPSELTAQPRPSIGRVLSEVLNAIVMDATTVDLERLARVNQTLELVGHDHKMKTGLRQVEAFTIHPSEDIGKIAREESKHLPRSVRYLVRGLGSRSDSSDLISYLLFEIPYTNRLVELGYRDGIKQQSELTKFFIGS